MKHTPENLTYQIAQVDRRNVHAYTCMYIGAICFQMSTICRSRYTKQRGKGTNSQTFKHPCQQETVKKRFGYSMKLFDMTLFIGVVFPMPGLFLHPKD